MEAKVVTFTIRTHGYRVRGKYVGRGYDQNSRVLEARSDLWLVVPMWRIRTTSNVRIVG